MSGNEDSTRDPCRAGDISGRRLLAFLGLFVLTGGAAISVIFVSSTYGILLASVLSYTAFVMLYGFSSNRNGIQSYLFTCPVVVNQYRRLLKRHAVFVAVLIAFVTIALKINPNPEAWMDTQPDGGVIPFYFYVAIPAGVLALKEIFMNRDVLERAHNARFGVARGGDDLDRGATITLFGRDQ